MGKSHKAKSFENWTREEVQDTFGIKRNNDLSILKNWLNTDNQLTEKELEFLADLHKGLRNDLDLYNEDELKFFFIGDVLRLVKFKTETYRAFTQRHMEFSTQTVDNQTITVAGIVELVVATGQQNPKKPFFFLQEFKQSPPTPRRGNFCSDPLGQLLIAMTAAKVHNNNGKAIYGCYVLGSAWYFVVLYKNEYGVSLVYDVTILENLHKIICLLKEQKKHIEQELGLC